VSAETVVAELLAFLARPNRAASPITETRARALGLVTDKHGPLQLTQLGYNLLQGRDRHDQSGVHLRPTANRPPPMLHADTEE